MSDLLHLPLTPAVDATLTAHSLSTPKASPLATLAQHSVALTLIGSAAVAAVLLTGLLTAILEAPALPVF